MWMFAEMLRSRVGSPLSLASMARDLNIAPMTLSKYLDILQAPKVYFYDTGLVRGDEGLRFENLVACHLLKQVQWQQDTRGAAVDLHYVRTKDEAEVDFCMSEGDTLTHLVECKLSDGRPHRALSRFAAQWPQAQAVQLLRDCKAEADIGSLQIQIRDAAPWLAALEV